MRKTGAFVLVLLLLFSLASLAIADNDTNNDTDNDVGQQQDLSKIEKGFECLEEKVDDDCSDADTIQELALTILASPDNVFDECVDKLKDEEVGDHYGNVRDTALAILALDHAGEDTSDAEEWLLGQSSTPTDLIWYIEQDSNQETQCKISYSGDDYTINIDENKKIDSDAGSCLSRAQSNFWLRVSSSCYEREFQISCDKDFIATLLYRNQNSATIYVLSDTESKPAFGTISLNVRAQYFGDYESTAWASLALLKTGHDIEDFIPYVIALADSNKRFLPNAFIYMLTGYEDYASELVGEQKLGNYWQADSTAYNKYYDTALALIALQTSSSEQITKARDWLLFSQATNGCWQNSIRDTAIVLWALEGRAGRPGDGGVTYCTQAGYFCIPEADCPQNEKLSNYFCSGLSTVCCMSENLLLCSEYGGIICASGKVCTGNERKATDTDSCCVGECIEAPEISECEDMGYICRDACSENQEEISYSCDSGQVCCRTKTIPTAKSRWWIWLLILAILVILGIIFRNKLKMLWFKLKTKFKRDEGKGAPAPVRPGMPPRPGFPPIRRGPPVGRPMPVRQTDNAMDNVFQKLKDMAK